MIEERKYSSTAQHPIASVRLGVNKACSSSRYWTGTNAVQYICVNYLQKIMDKLSHTILYTGYTNIVTSTNYNDLYKTVNVTLQLISEWFQYTSLYLIGIKHQQLQFHGLKLQLIP